MSSLQTPSSPVAVEPEDLANNQGEASGAVLDLKTVDQGDGIVRLDPNRFRDKLPTTAQMIEQPKQQPLPPTRKSAFDIDGMDPLFMESLGPQGLQNIADSHQIQNTVVNSATMVQRDSRNLAQSRYENVLQSI